MAHRPIGSPFRREKIGDAEPRIATVECELSLGLKTLLNHPRLNVLRGESPIAAFTLLRMHSDPVGVIGLDLRTEDPRSSWTETVQSKLGTDIDRHLLADGLPSLGDQELWVGTQGCDHTTPPCQKARGELLPDGPLASVIVATRERPASLVRCIESLLRMDYPHYEIIVVDNDPTTDTTEELLRGRYRRNPRVRYIREHIRGLASAHNCGLHIARGTVAAFTDDDVIVDHNWLSELILPFLENSGVAGATGLILPAELETRSQIMLELHGNFSKGFERRLYDLGSNRPDDQFFPFRAGSLGSGANMAFSVEYLHEVGGFDPALGAGTKAKGGDDLASLCQLVLSGRTLAYTPGAIVWHHHHRDLEALKRQAYGYGVGFGAFLASVSLRQPREAISWLTRLPAGATEFVRKTTKPPETPLGELLSRYSALPNWPRSLSQLQLRGLLLGPVAYLRSRVATPHGAKEARDYSHV